MCRSDNTVLPGGDTWGGEHVSGIIRLGSFSRRDENAKHFC